MKARQITLLALLASLSALVACKRENPHDNSRPPAPASNEQVQNHRFDGGESDPYLKPGEGGGEGGGEKAPAHE